MTHARKLAIQWGRIILAVACFALVVACFVLLAVLRAPAKMPRDPGQSGRYAVSKITLTTTNPDTNNELVLDIHYPSEGSAVNPSGAPYPAVVFAHGTIPFDLGTAALRSVHTGNAQHLAGGGFLVALPSFPDNDIEVRSSDVRHILSYLEAQNKDSGSTFFNKIDTDRFSVTGHSLGGASISMVAARDDRIQLAVVPLDPVNPDDNHWDYETEGGDITAPLGLIGAPPRICNWNARYTDEFPYYGSTHKAQFLITGGSHCDFMDAEMLLVSTVCGFLCGGFSETRLELVERYTAAWLSYYVRLDPDFYTYLYGAKAAADIDGGLVSRKANTAPHDVEAEGRSGAIELSWTLYDHPIIAGYNIYRSGASGSFSSTPYATVGRQSFYVDGNVVPGQQYFYVVRSRDPAGNEHQPSIEVSATASGAMYKLDVPLILKQRTSGS